MLASALLQQQGGAAAGQGAAVEVPAAGDYEVSVQMAAASADEGVGDPIEPVNRFFFGFNEAFQAMFLTPFTEFYEGLVPPPLRSGIGNMIDNIRTPVILANDLLQGEFDRAWLTTQRFAINTTYGVAGFVDRASEMGYEEHNEDFGQTLAVWGVGEGFYLVLPFFGPSNPRDAVGKLVVDPYFDALGYYLDDIDANAAEDSRTAVGAVDEYSGVMSELQQIRKTSIDYYAAIRSMYRQKRASEISNGQEMDLPPIPDLGYDFDDGKMGNLAAGDR